MAVNADYKLIKGTISEIEAQLRTMAAEGWRPISMASLFTDSIAVLLEKTT